MAKIEKLKLKFLVRQKAGFMLVSVKNVSNKFLHLFVFKSSGGTFKQTPNKTRLFFKRFRFIAGIVDRLVKNGLIS